MCVCRSVGMWFVFENSWREMFKFIFVIFINLWRFFYVVPKMHIYYNDKKYSMVEKYRLVQWVCNKVRKGIHVKTITYGLENLPTEGGYVMYPNHQGKYDALGIILSHEKPLSLVIEEKASHQLILTEVVELLKGKRLNNHNTRSAIKLMNQVAEEVKEGKPYIIFPEGYWAENHNHLNEFRAGSFKCAMRAKAPIVPVALVDSYKAFEGFDLIHTTYTYVYYLEPITYEMYQGKKTFEVSEMVKQRIEECIRQHEESERTK